MKKFLALFLTVCLLCTALVGCSSPAPQDSADQSSKTDSTASTPAEDSTPETDNTPSGDVPTLTWYMVGGGEPSNLASWTEKVNAYLEEKIGVHLDLQIVSWSDWGNRRTVLVQTNQPYDLIFTDMGSYASDVATNAFADLTDMISQTPGLTDLIPAEYLDCCRIDGKLYGIPAYKDSSMTNFFVWTKEHVDNYYPDYADAHDLASISDGLRAIKAGTGEAPLLLNQDGISCVVGNRYDGFGAGLTAMGVSYFSGEAKVVSVFEQDDVMDQLKILHQWMTEGLINSDAATLGEASGMCSLGVAQGWPAAAQGWGEGRTAEVVVSQFDHTVLSNDTVQGSITCISNSSQHKVEALKLLELVNTDTKLRDMLAYGEEGVNFEYVQEDGATKVNKINTDWTGAAYTQGTFMDMTVTTGTAADTYTNEVDSQNKNATTSPALGFHFEPGELADAVAACQATFSEYKSVLFTGDMDPEVAVPQMLEAMRDQGLDDILAEAQKQLDEFIANK